jgi:5-hydroxyisourate hydrolase
MSPITTHALDLTLGCPARGLDVVLSARSNDGQSGELARAATDDSGRVNELLPEGMPVPAGIYQLRFDIAAYYSANGARSFFPEVVVSFRVEDPHAHYHIPLLLSPHGYTTYRGS